MDPTGYGWFRRIFQSIFVAVASVLLDIVAPGAGRLLQAAVTVAAAVAGDQTGAAIDRAVARSSSQSSSSPTVPQILPSLPSSPALAGLGLASLGAGALTATATVAPASAGGGLGALTAGGLAIPGAGEVLGDVIAGILLYHGAAALREAYEEWDRGFEIIGYHATNAVDAQSIVERGFKLSRSDPANRFGPGYYLSDTPQRASAEYLNKNGYPPEAILQVRACLRKNLIVGGPLAERPISRWVGAAARAAKGSLMYGAFAPGAEGGINYVLFDPLHQVRDQERVR